MILVDTNVVSEVMRPEPNARVIEWLNTQDASGLFLSSVTIGEIRYGLALLPDGPRRSDLTDRFERFITLAFEQRTLPYDRIAAERYGQLMAQRRKLGRPMSAPDGQIASIAGVHGLDLATRNVRDFEACRVELINPFDLPGR